jgi:hypothetical protein
MIAASRASGLNIRPPATFQSNGRLGAKGVPMSELDNLDDIADQFDRRCNDGTRDRRGSKRGVIAGRRFTDNHSLKLILSKRGRKRPITLPGVSVPKSPDQA